MFACGVGSGADELRGPDRRSGRSASTGCRNASGPLTVTRKGAMSASDAVSGLAGRGGLRERVVYDSSNVIGSLFDRMASTSRSNYA